jgi:hypothetical protein
VGESAKNLMEKTNYLNKEILYLKNTPIVEYDIKSAGFTTIKAKKLLPPEVIADLEKLNKTQRSIYIGKQILKYPKIGEELINTLIDVRKDFAVLNDINEDDVLSIKKDAVFLIKKSANRLNIGDFEFRVQGVYTSYCYINGKEFYYSSKEDVLDIKGIPEEIKQKQENYLLKDIKKIIGMAEKLTSDQLFLFLKQYRSKYLNLKLDKEVYRDMETGKYSVHGYLLDDVDEETLKEIDISQNYISYLVPLFKTLI